MCMKIGACQPSCQIFLPHDRAGGLPEWNWTAMEYLNLASNNLTGPIPEQWVAEPFFGRARMVDLSNNQLNGAAVALSRQAQLAASACAPQFCRLVQYAIVDDDLPTALVLYHAIS